MTLPSSSRPTLRVIRGRQSGYVVLAALAIIAVTFIAAGSAVFEASQRFRTGHQSLRWSQAGQAAEAGAEITLMTAQKKSWVADGWSGEPGAPGTAAISKTFTLNTGVPAAGAISAAVSVEKVSMGGDDEWLRIRSKGIASLAGGARPGVDTRDVMLRKLSLRSDRTTATTVATPQAMRAVEILAEPVPPRPFQATFYSRQLFDIHTNTVTDSYDSSDPAKSNFTPFTTHGVYDAAKRQQNGDVGTMDAGNDWNLNSAHIWGDVLMPTTTRNAVGTTNVHGSVSKDLQFTFPTEVAPTWTVVTANHGVVSNANKSLTGGTEASPTRHKFTSIEMTSANKNILVKNPAGQTESWVEIWVVGDTIVDGVSNCGIKIDPGVHATIHFGGKVEIKGGGGGYALSNDSKLPANLIVRAYGGSSGASADFTLQSTDFWGVVSAPWYKVKFDMTSGLHVHGSFVTWQFDASDGTSLHYDEALGKLGLRGTILGYQVSSWVEAVR